VIIPSIVGLLVVFAVIYALKSNSLAEQPNTNQTPETTLAADPNSQPVQPGATPSGKSEQGIPAGGSIAPPANVSASPNANANANAEASPEPSEELSQPPPVNSIANSNSNGNTNSNANRKATPLPEPTRSVVPETVPAPAPTKTPEQKPPPVPTATPPGF
jgi:hypothetical protein